jgi:hypothetical protein
MVLRALAHMGGLVALCAALATGCEDNNLVTGPTPAGVTTGATVSVSTVAPPAGSQPGGSASTTTLAGSGAGGDATATVATVELAVRDSAGGCWEVLAPGAPAGVTRQDLWFPPGASCEGSGWAIALRVFGSPSALQAGTPAAATYRDGSVLVVVAPSATPGVQSVVKAVPGLVVVPSRK